MTHVQVLFFRLFILLIQPIFYSSSSGNQCCHPLNWPIMIDRVSIYLIYTDVAYKKSRRCNIRSIVINMCPHCESQ